MNEYSSKFTHEIWQGTGAEKTLKLTGEWTLVSGEIKVEGYENED